MWKIYFIKKLTFIREFQSGDIALVLLSSAVVHPEQNQTTQQQNATPKRAHAPGAEVAREVLQILHLSSAPTSRSGAVQQTAVKGFQWLWINAVSQPVQIVSDQLCKQKKIPCLFQRPKLESNFGRDENLQGRVQVMVQCCRKRASKYSKSKINLTRLSTNKGPSPD